MVVATGPQSAASSRSSWLGHRPYARIEDAGRVSLEAVQCRLHNISCRPLRLRSRLGGRINGTGTSLVCGFDESRRCILGVLGERGHGRGQRRDADGVDVAASTRAPKMIVSRTNEARSHPSASISSTGSPRTPVVHRDASAATAGSSTSTRTIRNPSPGIRRAPDSVAAGAAAVTTVTCAQPPTRAASRRSHRADPRRRRGRRSAAPCSRCWRDARHWHDGHN